MIGHAQDDAIERLMRDVRSGQLSRRHLLRRGLALGLSAPTIALLLNACGGDDESAPVTPTAGTGAQAGSTAAPTAAAASTTVASTTAARSGGTMVVAWEQDATTLDPAKASGGHDKRIGALIGDTLWSIFDDSAQIQPALAESWQASSDGLTWDVTLKPNLMFQDGAACDVDAVKWTFDRWMDPNHPFHDPPYGLLTYYLASLTGVEKTGDRTLRFHLSKPDAMFESNMLQQQNNIVSPKAFETLGGAGFGLKPVGTGTWQLTEWEQGVRIVLKRNESYWRKKPLLDELVITPIVDNAQRVSQLQTGAVDLVVAMSPEFIPQIESDPNLQLLQIPGMHIWWIVFNMHHEALKKKEVRQALNYAVNKEELVNGILLSAATVTPGPMHPASWANDPSLKPYPHDPKKAKDLLTAAGYPDGFTMRFWVPESGSGMVAPREIAQVVQANLKDVGVNVEIETQEWNSYLNHWGDNGLDKDGTPYYGMGEMSWNFPTPDPGFWLGPNIPTSSQPPEAFNAGFYSNPTVDDLWNKAQTTSDSATRTKHFQEIHRLLYDDCPWLFMFSANNIAAASKRLKGVLLNPNSSIIRFEGAHFEG